MVSPGTKILLHFIQILVIALILKVYRAFMFGLGRGLCVRSLDFQLKEQIC